MVCCFSELRFNFKPIKHFSEIMPARHEINFYRDKEVKVNESLQNFQGFSKIWPDYKTLNYNCNVEHCKKLALKSEILRFWWCRNLLVRKQDWKSVLESNHVFFCTEISTGEQYTKLLAEVLLQLRSLVVNESVALSENITERIYRFHKIPDFKAESMTHTQIRYCKRIKPRLCKYS